MALRTALLLAPLAALAAAELAAVPTFENCGIALRGAAVPAAAVRVRYRAGDGPWLEGHRLVASADDPTPRGSLFALRPATAYRVECLDAQGALLAAAGFTTWSEEVPVGRTVRLAELAPAGGPLRISQGGTADAWLRVVGDPGQALDGGEQADAAILVEDASFVLLDGLAVRGGRRHGIRVHRSHDVRVRGCDIAGFGRVGVQDLAKDGKYYGPDGRSINNDAGVFVDGSGRMVVERCFIHDPRGRANSWAFAHPEGPNALFVRATGELVVRWNDLVGGDLHRWNDVIEGWGNGKDPGGFNRDSDIHGNLMAFANDDGIELDGPQCNVRCYDNLITGTLCGISTAPNLRGPSFVIGNLIAGLGDERGVGSAATKNGGGPTWTRGTTFFYHNTVFGAGTGITAVGYGEDRERGMFLGVSRNNLFAVAGSGIRDQHMPAAAADYDHDLFSLPWNRPGSFDCARPTEPHGRCAAHGLADPAAGDYRPGPGSAARGLAAPIPGLAHRGADAGALAGDGDGAMPRRPDGLAASPAQIAFRGTAAAVAAARIRIALTSTGKGGRFRALPCADGGWLRATPAEGVVVPGTPLELEVACDPAALAGRGRGVGALLVRLEDGSSVPVLAEATVVEQDLRLGAEAEDLAGAADFPAREDAGASAGRYLPFQAAVERKPGAQGLDFPVSIPRAGDYRLSVRLRSPAPVIEHDSLFLSVDGGAPQPCHLAGAATWQWVEHTPPLRLEAGAHRLRLLPRESLDLDAVQLRSLPLLLTERAAPLAPAGR